jgi:hypothetical protein
MRLPAADWDAPDRAENRMQYSLVIIFLIDHVADRPWAGELQHERVHPADMIRHEKKPAGRQIFQTPRRDTIKAANQ